VDKPKADIIMEEHKPTVAFFGSSLVSSYWNGVATYFRGIIKYLYRLGYEVTFYEPNAFDRRKHVDLPNPDFARSVVYENHMDGVEHAVREALKADILIKASGVGVMDAFLERTLLEIKRPYQMVIFWDVDAPATLDSVLNNPEVHFRELIPRYDCILTSGGGQPVIDTYRALGAKECIPVYNALDPETHYHVSPVYEFTCDLAFLGNRLPDREERVSEFFIEVAHMMPDKNFILGGSGWEDMPLPSNIKYIGHVYTNQHNILNSSAKAMLNISPQSMADYGFSPATHVFEAAGAGACIITDYWQGIENFFNPSEEILVARNGMEVAELLREISDAKMIAFGRLAYEKVLEKHTYKLRVQQVSNILQRQRHLIHQ
jgi:spore maturation protein CgeB